MRKQMDGKGNCFEIALKISLKIALKNILGYCLPNIYLVFYEAN
jgi:hypothetical protein